MIKFDEFKNVSFDGAYDEGMYLLVSSEINNSMLKLNKETCKAEYLSSFPQMDYDILGQHHGVHKYKDCLIFTPDNATGIHVYNMSKNKMSFLAIDEFGALKARCISSFIVGNKLWLIYAYVEHPIVIIDLDLWEIETLDILKRQLPQSIIERNVPLFWSVLTCKGSKIYGAVWHSSYIVEIDIDTKKMDIIKLQNDEKKLTTVVCCEELFWCAEYNSTVVTCWNQQGDYVDRYTVANDVQMQEEGNFSSLILHGKDIYMVTNRDNCIYYLDKETKTIKVFADFPEGFATYNDIRKNWRRFFSYNIIGDMIRLYPTNANMMLDINLIDGRIKGYQFELEEKYNAEWYKKEFLIPQIVEKTPGKVFTESDDFILEDYIGFVLNS